MVVEGELKIDGKLYQEAFKLGALMTGLDSKFDSTDGSTVYLSIKQFLDEAKKDFYHIPLYSSADSISDEEKRTIENFYTYSVLPVVKKWFGGSS